MRWNCAERGCFNTVKRPKLEVFAECFPRGINFGDIDMIVEIGGHLLICEWKPSADATILRGQRLLHDALVSLPSITLIVICGDAETMRVDAFTIRRGSKSERCKADIDALKARIAKWSLWADRQKATLEAP